MESAPHRPMPDSNAWPVFTLAWDNSFAGPTDMSCLLEKPAGAAGFIKVVNGHLASGDGKRWRMWGQHLQHSMALPTMDMAPVVVGRMAQFGLNCLRLHFIDRLHFPDGLLMRNSESTRSLDPEALARFDWFVHCCKQQGVYLDLNLHVGRQFTSADGIRQPELTGWAKPMNYYDDWLITLQKEYAQQVLDHVNPFAGNRYAEEPAIALIEITNENSISEFWHDDHLRGEPTSTRDGWGDIPRYYAEELDGLWNAWLCRTYHDRATLAEAWGGDLGPFENPVKGSVRRLRKSDFASAPKARFQDESAFVNGLECKFFAEMKSFLRGKVGAQQLILGTSDHKRGWSGLPVIKANTVLDVTDSHQYWQHPIDPPAGHSEPRYILNTPMVDDLDHNAVAHLSRGAVEGYPHICSEVNEPAPNDHACEFIPIIAAYGRLQDWDGIVFYDYHVWNGPFWRDETWAKQGIDYWFDCGNDPVKMAQTALGAQIFLRGDVQTARETVQRGIPREWVLEGARAEHGDDLHPYGLPHLRGRLALLHRTRINGFDAAEASPAPGAVALPADAIVSDTGELHWLNTPGDGHVLIDAPRHQAIIGRAGKRSTRNLTVDLKTPFAAVQVSSRSDKPLAETDEMLLVAAARATNTDFTWRDDTRRSPLDWGHAPTRIEPVAALITFRRLKGATGVAVQPLDEHGQPSGQPTVCTPLGGGFALTLPADAATPWYLVQVSR